jgi:ribonuclease P/MRP protein subunit RPP40
MLNFPIETKDKTVCRATHGVMGHVDPQQPPQKRKPFVAILNHEFVQKVSTTLLDFGQILR